MNESVLSATPPLVPLRITLFGPMQVLVQGQPLPRLRSRKTLFLLALLTLRQGRPVERDWLAGTLWPEVSEQQSAASLRAVLSELRKALGNEGVRIQSPNRRTLLLDLSDAWADVLVFDEAIRRKDADSLERAVALYRGGVLEGITEEWVSQERSAREQACLRALQLLAEKATAEGNHRDACSRWQHALFLVPIWDTARRGLMASLAASGDTNAALQVYREFVNALRSGTGTAVPDDETTNLYRQLRTEARQQASSPPAQQETMVTGYLPHPLTELIGREDERSEIMEVLARTRLATLTGPGGIGKTRLAIAVAEDIVRQFSDGVWLVSLENVPDSDLVPQAVAQVLGVSEVPHRDLTATLAGSLKRKRLLLVLDNCEHLASVCASLAHFLLHECAGLRILATSREPLNIPGEAAWLVPPLAVPDPDHLPRGNAAIVRVLAGYDSIRLFVERAQAVAKMFNLTPGNARAVAEICHRLEGVPLAIELAAASIRAMTAEQIATHLKDRFSSPLNLLRVGSRGALSRQRTLRATIDWSYDLLDPSEQRLFRRLSIFVGGWSLETARAVVGENDSAVGDGTDGRLTSLLTSLVDKSLVAFTQDREESATLPYRMPEIIRQYALEKLQESNEAEVLDRKHREWCIRFAEEAVPGLRSPDQEKWQRRLVAEHDNLRMAIERAIANASDTRGSTPSAVAEYAEAAMRLAGALWWFWYISGNFNEGRIRLERALACQGANKETAARARALNGMGVLAHFRGDYDAARACHEESLTIQRVLGNQRGIADSLGNLANLAYQRNDFTTARRFYEECLEIFRKAGDRHGMAFTLGNLANVAKELDDLATARSLQEETLALFRAIGDRRGISWSLLLLGKTLVLQGEHDTAQAFLEESLTCFTDMDDKHGMAESLQGLGDLAILLADPESAQRLYDECYELFTELEERPRIAALLVCKADLARGQENYTAAKSLGEEALTLFRSLENEDGAASALTVLGDVALGCGDLSMARQRYSESLAYYRQRDSMVSAANVVDGLASVFLATGNADLVAVSVRLWGASHAFRLHRSAARSAGEQARLESRLMEARGLLGRDQFAVEWGRGCALSWEHAVTHALAEADRATLPNAS